MMALMVDVSRFCIEYLCLGSQPQRMHAMHANMKLLKREYQIPANAIGQCQFLHSVRCSMSQRACSARSSTAALPCCILTVTSPRCMWHSCEAVHCEDCGPCAAGDTPPSAPQQRDCAGARPTTPRLQHPRSQRRRRLASAATSSGVIASTQPTQCHHAHHALSKVPSTRRANRVNSCSTHTLTQTSQHLRSPHTRTHRCVQWLRRI